MDTGSGGRTESFVLGLRGEDPSLGGFNVESMVGEGWESYDSDPTYPKVSRPQPRTDRGVGTTGASPTVRVT